MYRSLRIGIVVTAASTCLLAGAGLATATIAASNEGATSMAATSPQPNTLLTQLIIKNETSRDLYVYGRDGYGYVKRNETERVLKEGQVMSLLGTSYNASFMDTEADLHVVNADGKPGRRVATLKGENEFVGRPFIEASEPNGKSDDKVTWDLAEDETHDGWKVTPTGSFRAWIHRDQDTSYFVTLKVTLEDTQA